MQNLPPDAALLVIDVQQGFDEPSWGKRNNPQAEQRIAELLACFRASKRPVLHARHMSTSPNSTLRPGQPGNEFKAQATPLPGEKVFEKKVNSCFIGTTLEAELRRSGYQTLVIAGLTTNHCVSTTARMAGNLGFETWVVSDATATFNRVGPDGIDYPAEQIHAIALSDLHGEFATVVDTKTVLAAAGKGSGAPFTASLGKSPIIAFALGLALAMAACATTSAEPTEPAKALRAKTMDQGLAAGRGLKGVETGDLDRKVDPCTDFYEFANGSWRAQNPIPASLPRWSRRVARHDANKGMIRDILGEISRKSDWLPGSPAQMVGDFYASCMDEAGLESQGLAPISPLLAAIEGIRTQADLQRTIGRLHELAVLVPFGTVGNMDFHEPANFVLNVVAGGLGLPDRDYYLKTEPHFAEAREKYRVHVASVLELGGMQEAQASKAAAQVFALEKRLAEASLDSASAGDPAATDHKLTFAQLKKLSPHFDWDSYFEQAGLPKLELNVAEPKFLQQLEKELQETPLAVWKTYLTWQLLESASPWLSKQFADESFNFKERVLAGATEPKPRALRCASATDALLPEPLAKKYNERYFPPEARAKAQEISQNLLAVLQDDVAHLDWLGKESQQKALEKLADYNQQLGHPDRWKDYSAVAIRRDALWANIAAGRKFAVDDNRHQVGKPTDRDLWQLTPSAPDAYIEPQLNQIVLPAGFLQPPAFNLEANDAVNYGAIGAGFAHDMTHTIDKGGSQFDAQGRQKSWWTETATREFDKRGQCLSDQYEGYFIEPGVHHDGKLVQSEAIGDLAGLHLAYLALQKSMVKSPVPVMDGFTPEQQFFISYGQYRGDSVRLEAQRQQVKKDIHPTSKFRVNGPLANLPEFQQAFSCKAGSEMVRPPEKRCAVW